MIQRWLDLKKTKRSVFLFGPRGVGKSTLIQGSYPDHPKTLRINLLVPEDEDRFSRNPSLLKELILEKKPNLVVIDEVQKTPKLLDVVHDVIESNRVRFILTGSSARKLKHGSANLLAGRASSYHLDALSSFELAKRFDLQESLEMGCLPYLYFPDKGLKAKKLSRADKIDFLQAYARTYLKEEIQLEQIVRKIDPFRHFLEVSAQMNGKIIEYATIARDVHVDEKTVAEYFSILEDTLVGFLLYPFHRSIRKKQGSRPKFYWFDPGVKRALDRTLEVPLKPQTGAYGEAFEHFVILEIKKIANLISPDIRLSFMRTQDGTQEIDLIVERPGEPIALIEIKSTDQSVDEKVVKKLNLFREDFPEGEFFILSRDPKERLVQGVRLLPWQKGILALFKKRLKFGEPR